MHSRKKLTFYRLFNHNKKVSTLLEIFLVMFSLDHLDILFIFLSVYLILFKQSNSLDQTFFVRCRQYRL